MEGGRESALQVQRVRGKNKTLCEIGGIVSLAVGATVFAWKINSEVANTRSTVSEAVSKMENSLDTSNTRLDAETRFLAERVKGLEGAFQGYIADMQAAMDEKAASREDPGKAAQRIYREFREAHPLSLGGNAENKDTKK